MKKTIIITAGPTREHLDPVRFISNMSSGKLGYLLAEQAVKRDYNVILISGPTNLDIPEGCQFLSITSALDLENALVENIAKANVLFMTSAVCDYRPARTSSQKIKHKQDITLQLECNPDILKKISTLRRPEQFICGFCLETNDLERFAKEKLLAKKLDAIVASLYTKKINPFGENLMQPKIFFKDGQVLEPIAMDKKRMAKYLIEMIETD